MKFLATKDNVIIKVAKKVKNPDELLIDTGEEEKILLGTLVAAGPDCHASVKNTTGTICVYKSRVATLPWEVDGCSKYVVKEENIYGILE